MAGARTTATTQNNRYSFTTWKRTGFSRKRRSTAATANPFEESMINVESKNQNGTSGGTAASKRIGRAPSRNTHQFRGWESSKAQSRTESGNHKGEADECGNVMPNW